MVALVYRASAHECNLHVSGSFGAFSCGSWHSCIFPVLSLWCKGGCDGAEDKHVHRSDRILEL